MGSGRRGAWLPSLSERRSGFASGARGHLLLLVLLVRPPRLLEEAVGARLPARRPQTIAMEDLATVFAASAPASSSTARFV